MVESEQLVDVLHTVMNWPVPMRISLARAILESVESSPELGPDRTARRGKPVEKLIGLGAGPGEPPSDATVKQWLDEHRTEKYGR